jgi:transcriptional regulator with XRE-family HTH domain
MAGLTQRQVAIAAGLSVPTIKRIESNLDVPRSDRATRLVIKVLERHVVFVDENVGGAGVRPKKRG